MSSGAQRSYSSNGQTGPTGAILAALGRGATLLTPNVRAARFWADCYDAGTATRNAQSWQAADILPWRVWAAAQWQEAVVLGLDGRVLLNEMQESALWTSVIGQFSTDTLRSAASQAKLCMGAIKLLGSYDVASRFLKTRSGLEARTADAATFYSWYSAFENVCSREGYLPASHLDLELAALLRRRKVPRDGEYILCGFHHLLPAQQALVEALQANGVVVHRFTPELPTERPPSILCCSNPETELTACVQWVRAQLETAPGRSITVVVPDLNMTGLQLERELRAVVAPETADITRPAIYPPYEFSNGRALRQLPMIRDALRMLRWCAQEIALDDAGALLRSHHLMLAETPESGAEQDIDVLRTHPHPRKKLSLRQAEVALAKYSTAARLATLDGEARVFRKISNTFAWFADRAGRLLQSAGWPGTAPLNGDEFQAVDRWNRMLDGLTSLDLLGEPTNFRDFLQQLEALAGHTLFLPENRNAPVQVVSVGEAAGSTTDAMWFLHANADTWPPLKVSHPLLPLHLQRELGMPGTDLLRDEEAAQALLETLVQGAGSIRFSWSGGEGEDAGGPSPLIEHFTKSHGGEITDTPVRVDEEIDPPSLEQFLDEEPLPPLLDGQVAGGVGVLTAQAQCGFRAFAEKRLFAAPLDALDAGLSPRERGEQVHAVLQMFWDAVHDQRTLISMSRDKDTDGSSERDRLLRRCIHSVCRTSVGEAWDDAYLQVQQRRLFRLLSAWLDVEANRPPFRVLHTEKQIKDVPLGSLRLTMRVDRIDQVAAPDSEGILLIDYKTGPASLYDWLTDRPDAPQLPAYAVVGAQAVSLERVDGVAFASVRVGNKNMKLEGMAHPATLIGSKRNRYVFEEQVENWRVNLEALANAFAGGDASVDPKIYPKTCDTCAQRILCRVDAARLLQLDEPEAEDDEAPAWA